MGKAYLNKDEIDQLPTLAMIDDLAEGENPETWGLCQHTNGNFDLTNAGDEWFLHISFGDICDEAKYQFGNGHSYDDIRVIFLTEDTIEGGYVTFELVDGAFYQDDDGQSPNLVHFDLPLLN